VVIGKRDIDARSRDGADESEQQGTKPADQGSEGAAKVRV